MVGSRFGLGFGKSSIRAKDDRKGFSAGATPKGPHSEFGRFVVGAFCLKYLVGMRNLSV